MNYVPQYPMSATYEGLDDTTREAIRERPAVYEEVSQRPAVYEEVSVNQSAKTVEYYNVRK